MSGFRASGGCFRVSGDGCSEIMRFTRTSQILTAEAVSNNSQTTIQPTANIIELTSPNGACVFEGTQVPFIAPGLYDGQIVVLRNMGASAIQFNNAIANSQMRVAGNVDQNIGLRDWISFIWHEDEGFWDQWIAEVTIL
jgi:hypothetical protein